MDGWTWLIFGATGFLAAVVYLKGVACEVESAQTWLKLMEQAYRAAQRKRIEAAQKEAEESVAAAA